MVWKRTKKINGMRGSGEKSTKKPSKFKQITQKVKSFFTTSKPKPVISVNNPGLARQFPSLKQNPLYKLGKSDESDESGEPHYATIAETHFHQPTYAQPNTSSNKSHYSTLPNFYSIDTSEPTKQQPLTPDNLKSKKTHNAITALQKAYIENPGLIKISSGNGTSRYNIGKMQKLLTNEGITDNNLIKKLTSDVSQRGLSAVSETEGLAFNKQTFRDARKFNKEKFIQSMPDIKKNKIRQYIEKPRSYYDNQKIKSRQLDAYLKSNASNNSKSRLIAKLIQIGKDKTIRGETASLSSKNVGNAIARVNKISEIRQRYGIENVSGKTKTVGQASTGVSKQTLNSIKNGISQLPKLNNENINDISSKLMSIDPNKLFNPITGARRLKSSFDTETTKTLGNIATQYGIEPEQLQKLLVAGRTNLIEELKKRKQTINNARQLAQNALTEFDATLQIDGLGESNFGIVGKKGVQEMQEEPTYLNISQFTPPP